MTEISQGQGTIRAVMKSREKTKSRRRGRRRSRSRYRQSKRRRNASADGDGSGSNYSWRSDDGSSTEEDSVKTGRGNGPLRIKLQKFDGSSSWETWWAHFKNCASYNRWTERDRLAFMKGALTGNAAQVLWDTDRSTIGSFQKLVDMIKSRYSGERQA